MDDRPLARAALAVAHDDKCQWHETEIVSLKKTAETQGRELWQLSQRIPEDLREILITLRASVDRLMEEGLYVKKADFDLLRLEHDQMKRLVYGALGIILTAFTVALVALVWKA